MADEKTAKNLAEHGGREQPAEHHARDAHLVADVRRGIRHECQVEAVEHRDQPGQGKDAVVEAAEPFLIQQARDVEGTP